jgi:ParB family chromosome partitioning protein
VTNLLRLLQLPAALRQMLTDSRLEMGHARALLGLPTHQQLELADQIAAKGMSVREAETLAARAAAGQSKGAKHPNKTPDRDIAGLEEELSDLLGTAVKISSRRNGRGKLMIEYGSLDQLDGLLERLRR